MFHLTSRKSTSAQARSAMMLATDVACPTRAYDPAALGSAPI